MIADLKPYAEYKESGINWLGLVPQHWAVRRMKYVLREKDMRSTDGKEQLLRVSQYTGVTQRLSVEGSDIPDTRADTLIGYKCVEPNDLVINIMLAWNGSLGISRYKGIASPAYCVYRFGHDAYSWYFHHLLKSPIYKSRIKAVSTGVVDSRLRLYSDDLYRIESLLPPSYEQAAIVRFLDYASHRIDRTIRAKKKVIALLNEQKQAIIHRAVTRGLNPSVPFKPSGIPWLGDIPEHWEVRPLKYWAKLNNRTLSDRVSPEYEFRYLDIGTVGTGRLVREPVRIKFKQAPSRARRVLRKGDTIISTVRTYLKAVYFVDTSDTDLIASTGFAVLSPGPNVLPEFLSIGVQSPAFIDRVTANSIGIAYPAIAESRLGAFHLAIPPDKTEQAAILKYVRSSSSPFDTTISRTEREISLLREYRTRLIADVVTGKLDVREAARNLPEEIVESGIINDNEISAGDEEMEENMNATGGVDE